MADSERVLEFLGRPDDVEIIGIVVNRKGRGTGDCTRVRCRRWAFLIPFRRNFLRRNQHADTAGIAATSSRSIATLAHAAGLDVVAYVSMAFGNPYGDPWSTTRSSQRCEQLIDAGVRQISLADTVGLAATEQIAETVAAVLAAPRLRLRLACTCMRSQAKPQREFARLSMRAAGASMRRSAVSVVARLRRMRWWGIFPRKFCSQELAECGAELPEFLQPLDDLIASSAEIAREPARPCAASEDAL